MLCMIICCFTVLVFAAVFAAGGYFLYEKFA